MTRQMLIYDRVVPIGTDTHADVSVEPTTSFAFAREINSAPLLAVEFLAAALDHPVVFSRSNDGIFPAVLLGLRPDQNEHVGHDGMWSGGYIPAFLRRYPFVFSRADDEPEGSFTLCLDDSSPVVNRENRGERLFDAQGERTAWLESKLAFASEFHTQFHKTRAFCQRIEQLGLLEDSQARYRRRDGIDTSMGGFAVINRTRLKQVMTDDLPDLFRSGCLELCFAHLHSLQNILKLGDAARYGADAGIQVA
jgi:hypothetical protein